MPQLLILRHAKSDWDSESATDFDRPLSKRGKRDGQRVGVWLAQQRWVPDLVVCSPAKRTRQTAALVCGELSIGDNSIVYDERIYASSVETLLEIIRAAPDSTQRLLLVSHNPESADLVQLLSREELMIPADGKLVPTGTSALFEFTVAWPALGPGSADLLSITRPGELADAP